MNKDKPILLAVDDARENLDILESILSDDYCVVAKTSGFDAVEYLKSTPDLPRIVMLDIKMPGMDGYQVLEAMQADSRLKKIPVIVLTGSSSERRALDAGAADYVAKPFHPGSIKKRIQNQVLLHTHMDELEKQVQKQVDKINNVWNRVLQVMSDIIECRNLESGRHVKRSVELYGVLLNDLLDNSEYSDELMALGPGSIIKGVTLHDIGKIGIPDNILMKPGPLTPEEFEVMKKHTEIGRDLVDAMMEGLEEKSWDLWHCRMIAYEHHEKYDGSGYPQGLSGWNISLPARIMAVVDVYDAMVNKRVYKDASTHEETIWQLKSGSGRHFDPVVVAAALRVEQKFRDIEMHNPN